MKVTFLLQVAAVLFHVFFAENLGLENREKHTWVMRGVWTEQRVLEVQHEG